MAQSKTRKLVEDLKRSLRERARINIGLTPADVREEIPAGKGRGLASSTSSASDAGGIASPLTEQPGTRTNYVERYVFSTDGVFAIAHQPVLQAAFTDAVGREVKFNYADPDA
ncbi:MAG: hypothetical protein KZQ93_15765 [Candidatus Thiodiazotropha sp. (ex Monitilora ramsayi)]|nr:hypothetical protein [Candidatus Thiodiazotropha sp. (ex Monitilora ramsayi)]